MAEALVSAVLTQLTTIVSREAEQEIRLVVGVKEDVQKLTSMFKAIQVVLVDAENKQLKSSSVREWLDKLKNVAYDMEDVLDEWNTSIRKRQLQLEGVYGSTSSITSKNKVCSFFTSPCVCFGKLSLRHEIAHKIKTLNKKLEDIVREKKMYEFSETRNVVDDIDRLTTSLIDESKIKGRDEEKSTLVNKLLSGSSEGGKDLHVISLVGLGGIGKTTLAKLAYNHDEIENGFEERGWVCVSQPVDRIRIAKTIIQQLKKGRASSSTELEPLLQEIIAEIKEKKLKKFLLVLDDVWTENRSDLEDLFFCLKKSCARCTVLVTTRSDSVASVFGSDIISVEELSEDKCWSLFSQLAFSQGSPYPKEFEEVGRKIVAKCKGLPLAAKALGSLLRFKETIGDWESILGNEIWKLYFDKGPLPSLLLSYNYLPYTAKRCFLYCAIFPKGYTIWKDDLIQLWMGQGFLASKHSQVLEMIGNEYFKILANLSFFQEIEKDMFGNVKCKMHDFVHDLAQYLTQNECLTIEANGDENPGVQSSDENARHVTIVLNDGASLPISYIKSKTLRSLLVQYNNSRDTSIWEILNQQKSLRALKLVGICGDPSHEDILKDARNLIQLKYFDVSESAALKGLPEGLCEFYNLQTLNVSYCINLEKLPRGIEKLINLRHLINFFTYSLSYMPKGIERLTHLRTLNEFVVSDSNHAEEASSLKSLRYLKHLEGRLTIRRLGNVRDVSEAKEAKLHNKEKLTVLHLHFNASDEEESTRTAEDHEQLLVALQPLPPNLQELLISYYMGKYISQICLTPLIQLRELHIGCDNLENLPPLGNWPSLCSLLFDFAPRLKNVSTEFLGVESRILTSTSPTSPITVFPKLTYLRFGRMFEWEEWDYGIIGKDENIQIMPSLAVLRMRHCPKLKALPDLLFLNASLEKLFIMDCPLLFSYLKKRGQQWPIKFHIPEIYYQGPTEDDSDSWQTYKSVIDPKEHKFEFKIDKSDTYCYSDTEQMSDTEEESDMEEDA